ncbi:MAG: hypothetical protein HOJ29_00045, partial [Candidatus Magasanikbacteria bacterium]|nr:hypothetical protein [Candidatus Magasanikbacteria bacterium]
MDLPLIFHPNSDILQVECTPLSTEDIVSEKVQTMIDNMIPTMYHGQGIGLAAPQIGTTIQVCIIGKDAFPKKVMINGKKHDRSKDLILINPVWEKTARRTYWDTEGCLSIPKIYGK